MSFGADRQLKALQDAGIQASIDQCATISPPKAEDYNGPPDGIQIGIFQEVVLYLVPAEHVAAAEKLDMVISEQGPGKALDPARTTYYDCHKPC